MPPRPLALIALLLLPGLAACSSCKSGASADAGAVASTDARADAVTSAGAAADDEGEEVRPVYPPDTPPDPLAQRLCEALHEVEANQRATCCSAKPGTLFTRECVRNLSGALATKAVTLKPEDVDACAAAMKRTFEGCDWVGPVPPSVPAECIGIVHGTLDAGARCRSTLECTGDLRCHGVGPTSRGRCGPARDEGGVCGAATDPLVGYVRDTEADAKHPECKGFCYRHKCAAFLAEEAGCTLTMQCGQGKRCLAGKCKTSALPKVGEACPDDQCDRGLACVGRTPGGSDRNSNDKVCAERKPTGASCTNDFECIGGCVKGADAGNTTKGTCGKQCRRL